MKKQLIVAIAGCAALLVAVWASLPLSASGQPPVNEEYHQHLRADLDYHVSGSGIFQISPTLLRADGSQERVRAISIHLEFGHGSWELSAFNLFELRGEGDAEPIRACGTIIPRDDVVEVPGDGTLWANIDARPAEGKTWYDVRSEEDLLITITADLKEPGSE